MKRGYLPSTLCVLAAVMCASALLAPCQAKEQTGAGENGSAVKTQADVSLPVLAASAPAISSPADAENIAVAEDPILHFEIRSYTLDGATLLTKQEVDQAVAPYIGKDKDFSDVQRALEAIEELYAQKNYSAVHVLLPEQELEQGTVIFHVIESRFGKIKVKDNKFFSEANALNAIPSVRIGGFPRSRQIARELKLANENPARQLNVVLNAGDKDEEVDASLLVTDSKPGAWGVTLDNTGSPETGLSRMGLSYRHANLFDRDHVGSLQMQVSPQYLDRVKVLGGGYKVPLYQWGDSIEFSGGYSNVNSVVGGFSNFQGGGVIFGARYNHPLDKVGKFEPRLAYGVDLRDFKPVRQTNPPVTVLYNEIMVTPFSVSISAQGKLKEADVGLNASVAANFPWISKGRAADFANYDQVNLSAPNASYRVLRFGGSYAQSVYGDWQLRATGNGQWSGDVLIQGEQLRLGGMDGVRGFSEGSEGGEKGLRGNFEGYTPAYARWNLNTRALAFVDMGQASASNGNNATIASSGIGLRSTWAGQAMLRMDVARIFKAASDPQQQAGNWRAHIGLSATF